jgi:thiopurine S-methyltransferase
MDAGYWRKRWREGQIGFHQGEVHRHLIRFWPELAGSITREVLVPLCGKSLDLAWLRDQGHRVTGVEIAPEACLAFLAENQLSAPEQVEGAFRTWRLPGLTLQNGDFFLYERDDFDLVWDRAALVALSAETRPKYADHLVERLLPGGKILLVTIVYDPAEMEGPPYSVPDEEVGVLFRGLEVEPLLVESQDREGSERFGLTHLEQRVYRITV